MKNIHTELKLPKQWKRWFKKAGLKDSYDSSLSRRYGQAYFKGHGRHWRIDATGNLDMSEPFATFDRWANSLEKSVPMTAKTEKEFYDLVMRMLPEFERLKFRFRGWRPKTDFAKLLRKLKLNAEYGRAQPNPADILITLDSIPQGIAHLAIGDFHPLTDEAERASRSHMRVLKGRPAGELEVIACGVGKGRSIFFSTPSNQHLDDLVTLASLPQLPLMYRGEPGPSLEERLEDLTRALGHEGFIHAEANCLMSAPPQEGDQVFKLRREYRDAPLDVTTLGSSVREWMKP